MADSSTRLRWLGPSPFDSSVRSIIPPAPLWIPLRPLRAPRLQPPRTRRLAYAFWARPTGHVGFRPAHQRPASKASFRWILARACPGSLVTWQDSFFRNPRERPVFLEKSRTRKTRPIRLPVSSTSRQTRPDRPCPRGHSRRTAPAFFFLAMLKARCLDLVTLQRATARVDLLLHRDQPERGAGEDVLEGRPRIDLDGPGAFHAIPRMELLREGGCVLPAFEEVERPVQGEVGGRRLHDGEDLQARRREGEKPGLPGGRRRLLEGGVEAGTAHDAPARLDAIPHPGALHADHRDTSRPLILVPRDALESHDEKRLGSEAWQMEALGPCARAIALAFHKARQCAPAARAGLDGIPEHP